MANRPALGWTTFSRNHAYQPGVPSAAMAPLTIPWTGVPSPKSHEPLVTLLQPAGMKTYAR